MNRLLWIVLLGSALSCNPQQTQESVSKFDSGVSVGVIKDKKMREASGLVASINNPGMLWTHGDSGNDSELFLIDNTGKLNCTVRLAGITNRDWEDITVGPGPEAGKTYLYIGDIGDNKAQYNEKFIYRLEEPVWNSRKADTTISVVDKITFKLSDGVRDCESLMVDPKTRNLFIFSKREQQINLYKLSDSLTTTQTYTAERVLEKLPFTLVVAADISKDGEEILMKNYNHVYYWKRNNNESIEQTLSKPAQELKYVSEPQGESIAFDVNGTGYYTLSEQKKKTAQHLYFYKRQSSK